MFIFDIETLGKESTSVILSFACIHFDPANKPTYQELRESAFFAKIGVDEQVRKYNRIINKNTMEWWSKQCLNAKKASLIPDSKRDISIGDAIENMRQWSNQFKEKDSWVWARGNMDQSVLNSMEERLGIEPVFVYNRWRDVRTAIDLWYETSNGYCDVEHSNFDSAIHVTKHEPIDDCAYDVMMMLYGKSNNA